MLAFFDASFAGLADGTRAAIIRELGSADPERAEPASGRTLQALEERDCGELVREWGIGAARRVGIARDRVDAVIDNPESDEAANELVTWFNHLSGPELSAILSRDFEHDCVIAAPPTADARTSRRRRPAPLRCRCFADADVRSAPKKI